MQNDIHPDNHLINVVFTDGTTRQMYSTYGSEGDTLTLEICPNSHPAWLGGNKQVLIETSSINKFNKKYGDLFE